MMFSKLSDEQLELTYKQAESMNPVNYDLLRELRFEMYRRGFTSFHGISFEEIRRNNPYLAEEYEEWSKTQV
jgi:hypothetical protein